MRAHGIVQGFGGATTMGGHDNRGVIGRKNSFMAAVPPFFSPGLVLFCSPMPFTY